MALIPGAGEGDKTTNIKKTILKPPDKPPDIFARYCIAVVSAWTAELVTYPFDLTKTRLQIQSEVGGYKIEHKGMVSTALGIARKEGVLKLWTGMLAMYQRHTIYSGCRLILYEHFREMLKDKNGYLTLLNSSVAGLLAGGISQFIASPTDLVKVQMQAEGRRVLQGRPPRFANLRQAYVKLYSESGVLGFWRGSVPNVQRAALVNMGDLAAYDFSKKLLIKEFGFPDTITVHAIAAFVAGLSAAIMSTPADLIKTRLMNQPVGKDGRGKRYSGMVDCFRQSVKNEGFLALYNGFVPNWLRMGPWALVNWVVFENIMIAIGEKTF